MKKYFRRFWDAFWRPEMLILPGQVAFFLFLSLVPTITLIGYACSYLNVSNDIISTLITKAFGVQTSSFITPIITDTSITPAFFITLGIGYFVASNGMSSIIVASNTIYGIKDAGFFKRRLKAMIMEVIIVLLLLFVVIGPLLGNSIIGVLHYFNTNAKTTEVVANTINFLKGPLSWGIVFIFIMLIYTIAPDKKVPARKAFGGALFTTCGWILLTTGYSYYINHFANYSLFYGSLANIVILMLWFYFLAYIMVIGMAMNSHEELEKTGIIEVHKVIEESANSASIYADETQKLTKKEVKNK